MQQAADKSWPLKRLSALYHLGTLNPADKGIRGNSYEGVGLSVSLHPDAWLRIAKLGGTPRWELRKANGRFLDLHRLSPSRLDSVRRWGLQEGYLELQPAWQVSWVDDEDGCRRTVQYDRQDRAADEFEDIRETGHGATLCPVQTERASARLVARCGFDPGGLNDLTIAVTFFAEDVLSLDGVWWDDLLDVAALSAPRGVINLTALPSWAVASGRGD
jgi:hypothetical protein